MQNNTKLSIVIPVYNEKNTIDEIIRRVQSVEFEKEIIIVDDCSNDGTRDRINKISGNNIKKLFHEKNKGKGAALRTGFQHVSGDIVIIQDADLEYNPKDYPETLKLLADSFVIHSIIPTNGPKLMKYIVEAFSKVFENINALSWKNNGQGQA